MQNRKAGQRGIQYLPLLNILDMFDNEIFTCSGEKKNELTFQLSIMAFICFKMSVVATNIQPLLIDKDNLQGNLL